MKKLCYFGVLFLTFSSPAFPGSDETDDNLWEVQEQEDALWLSNDNELDYWANTLDKFKYTSHIATWFASSLFRDHPNNPTKDINGGPLTIPTGNGTAKVNHIEVFPIDDNFVEVFIYIRKDTEDFYDKYYGDIDEDDPFDDLMRIVLDVSNDNWDNWKVAEYNGQSILDVILTSEDVYNAVRSANGGDVDGRFFADPVSLGVPDIVQTPEGKYCFIGFKCEDAADPQDRAHSEGQIVAIKLDGEGTP